MKKWWMILLCAALTVSCAACGTAGAPETTAQDSAQVGNPFVECKTMEQAAEIAGFTLQTPDALDGYPDKRIEAVRGEMVQVFYTAKDGSEVLIRKGLGESDISGDYNHYDDELVKWVGDLTVNFRGSGENVNVAYWITDKNAYSISISNGMPRETLESLIPAIQ